MYVLSYQLFETRSHHVAQADLKLLGSSDPPTSASQLAKTTGMCTVPDLTYSEIHC
jgi:hypothetical protein